MVLKYQFIGPNIIFLNETHQRHFQDFLSGGNIENESQCERDRGCCPQPLPLLKKKKTYIN